MSIIVFTGPTLSPDHAAAILPADYRPPVSEGDVYRASLEQPQAIGILDGYFANVPSVWHKEILHAMAQGIHVFGSASMGALRAAELAAFGMVGVGATFEAFKSGLLEDDDEVAVIHGPAELGYPALSEAMVNIRRSLSDAFGEGVISATTRESLEGIGKALDYRKRHLPRIIAIGRDLSLAENELCQLESWLAQGRVDQKREDAILMLQTMRERLQADAAPMRAGFHFEHTSLWENATRLAIQPGASAASD